MALILIWLLFFVVLAFQVFFFFSLLLVFAFPLPYKLPFSSQRMLKAYINSCIGCFGVIVIQITQSPEEYFSYCLHQGSINIQIRTHSLCTLIQCKKIHSSYLNQQIAGGKVEVARSCIICMKSHQYIREKSTQGIGQWEMALN